MHCKSYDSNKRRQHYVFNSKGNKIPEDSKSNEISSIQNCKTLNKPNYKFYYSFGTSKPPSMNQELNINKEKGLEKKDKAKAVHLSPKVEDISGKKSGCC